MICVASPLQMFPAPIRRFRWTPSRSDSMLAVYTKGPDGRRRRWSPTTIAVSVLAHGAAIAALAIAAQDAEAKPVTEEVIAEWNLDDKPKPPPPPPPVVQPEPPKVDLAPKVETP